MDWKRGRKNVELLWSRSDGHQPAHRFRDLRPGNLSASLHLPDAECSGGDWNLILLFFFYHPHKRHHRNHSYDCWSHESEREDILNVLLWSLATCDEGGRNQVNFQSRNSPRRFGVFEQGDKAALWSSTFGRGTTHQLVRSHWLVSSSH